MRCVSLCHGSVDPCRLSAATLEDSSINAKHATPGPKQHDAPCLEKGSSRSPPSVPPPLSELLTAFNALRHVRGSHAGAGLCTFKPHTQDRIGGQTGQGCAVGIVTWPDCALEGLKFFWPCVLNPPFVAACFYGTPFGPANMQASARLPMSSWQSRKFNISSRMLV